MTAGIFPLGAGPVGENRPVHAAATASLNDRELVRYVRRISDRWPLIEALLGGARVADLQGAGPQRERGHEFVVILVSDGFAGVPWLERVHQASALWDTREMGETADVHCYTPPEFVRKQETLRTVRETADGGVDLLAL